MIGMMKERKTIGENRTLKARFNSMGLELTGVWCAAPEHPDWENRTLTQLLEWVEAYKKCPDRARLEEMGYYYPPVEPGFDPDSDWLRFEKWLAGESLNLSFVAEAAKLPDPQSISDEDLERELNEMIVLLARHGVSVDFQSGVPSRLVYARLRREMAESEFEIMAPGTICHLTGCTGYCPECFQRPWCEMGQETDWPEDQEAGTMVVPQEVKRWISEPELVSNRVTFALT